jgi:hypothetical protein
MAIQGRLNSGILATGQNKFGTSLAATADGNTLIVGMPQPVNYFNQEPPAANGAVFEFIRGGNHSNIQTTVVKTGNVVVKYTANGTVISTTPYSNTVTTYQHALANGSWGVWNGSNSNSSQGTPTSIPGINSVVTDLTLRSTSVANVPSAGRTTTTNISNTTTTINGNYNIITTGLKLVRGSAETYENFNYGYEVAVNSTGGTVAVGERYATVNNVKFAGQVTVYTNSYTSANVVTLPTPTKNSRFGSSIALSANGNIMVVGSPGSTYNGEPNVGEAHLYFWSPNVTTGTYEWIKQTQVFNANTDRAANIFFGNSIAMSNTGDAVVIGAPGVDSENNPNIGAAYLYTYDSKTAFTGKIVSSVLVVDSTAFTSATDTIKDDQYISGPGISLGTKVKYQITSSEPGNSFTLSGCQGSNTVTISSNVLVISPGYTVTCATSGIVPVATTVTGVIGNTVTLSQALTGNAVNKTLSFASTVTSPVVMPIQPGANNTTTLYIGDYSNVGLNQFVTIAAVDHGRVANINSHAITISASYGSIATLANTVIIKPAGRGGYYEVSPNNTTGIGVAMSTYAWRPYPTKLSSPSEVAESYFGRSVATSNTGNVVVIGTLDGAYVYDGEGNHTASLTSVKQRPVDTFGKSVAVNGEGNVIAISAPGRAVKIMTAREVYTVANKAFTYEIANVDSADWANLGVISANVTVANITEEQGVNVMYVTSAVSYANSSVKVPIDRIPVDSYINVPGSTAVIRVLAPLTAYVYTNGTRGNKATATASATASANVPWRFSVEYTGTVSSINDTGSCIVSSVYTTDGNTAHIVNNIVPGTRFNAINTDPNPNIGNGTVIGYNFTGTANAGAIYKFVNDGKKWEQKRTLVVDSDNTEWNKLGQVIEMSADGNTVYATSTGVEQFGRTNEGGIYVFNIN